MPPLPPENTGSPTAPIIIYTSEAQKDSKGDSITEHSITARSEADTGTGPMGTTINELMLIIAAKTPLRTIL